MTAKPIYRLPKAARRSELLPFVGREVVVYEDIHRNGERVVGHEGTLVAVACPRSGTVADQVIVRLRPGWLMDGLDTTAISIASVAGVRGLVHPYTATVGVVPEEVDR